MLVLTFTLFPNMLIYFIRRSLGEGGLPFYGGYTEGVHLFPFRTEQLSPSWPMVLDLVPGE